jgi:hypothetical protein
MTPITVWGDAGGIGQPCEERSSFGSFLGGHSYRSLSCELPPSGVEVDLDHDEQRVGELVRAELGEDERLRAVCVLDDDRLQPVLEEHEVFFSPLMMMSGKGIDQHATYVAREGELLGLSLTLATKRVAPRPLEWRLGDVRDSLARYSWPLSWKQSPLLERAAEVGLRERARRIVDLRPSEADFPYWRLREGQRAPRELQGAGELPGGWRRSAAPGRVLRVR